MKTPIGKVADTIGDHVLEAQGHLALLVRRLCNEVALRDASAGVHECLVELTASLSNLEDLSCDVRELALADKRQRLQGGRR